MKMRNKTRLIRLDTPIIHMVQTGIVILMEQRNWSQHSGAQVRLSLHSQSEPHRDSQCEADRGSQITLVGLYSNVVLTSAKGLAGVYMHSASLLADAVHSLSGSCLRIYT